MYGAILGDIIGSPYEFDFNNYKSKDFPLFCRHSEFTDDTVMTLAVAKALLDTCGQDDAAIKTALVHQMQQLGRAYPDKGYGAHFNGWLYEDAPRPYNSYGNGSAMRVSAAAELAEDMEQALHLAKLTAEVTHNHPEGIKGAPAAARRISGRMWNASSATTSAAAAMKFALTTIMWRAVRRQSRRRSPRFWKARILKTRCALRCPSAETATRWPPSPAASPRRSMVYRRT